MAASRGACASAEYRAATAASPACPMRTRRSSSSRHRSRARTHSCSVRAERPVTPSSITSRLAAIGLTTAGTPTLRYWMAFIAHLPALQASSSSGMNPTSSGQRSSPSVSARHGRLSPATPGMLKSSTPTTRWRKSRRRARVRSAPSTWQELKRAVASGPADHGLAPGSPVRSWPNGSKHTSMRSSSCRAGTSRPSWCVSERKSSAHGP